MSEESSPAGTINRKERMLKALEAHHGIVTRAAKAAGITPQTHYNWYREDQDYQNQVEMLKYKCHEEFKDLVMDAVLKKIQEGNTSIIAMCYKSLFKKIHEFLEIKTPYKQNLKAAIRLVSPPPRGINYSKDPFTQQALREYDEKLAEQRRQPPGP
jgi:hypothetical protein